MVILIQYLSFFWNENGIEHKLYLYDLVGIGPSIQPDPIPSEIIFIKKCTISEYPKPNINMKPTHLNPKWSIEIFKYNPNLSPFFTLSMCSPPTTFNYTSNPSPYILTAK